MAATVSRIEDVPSIAVAGVNLHALRRTLGVTAFGINAYTAQAGELVIEEHDEEGDPGHEELYVVLTDAATFTLDGEERDAPAGSLVWIPDPPTRRKAVATEDGTTVLALGGAPGTIVPSAWEYRFVAQGEADPERAYNLAAGGLEDHPDDANLHYDLACFASLAGKIDLAREHFTQAVAINPRAAEWAKDDDDLANLRQNS